MSPGRIALGAVAYTISTFSLAFTWHIVLFEEEYRAFGYFEGEPNFVLGVASIVIQGVVLSALFPLVRLNGNSAARALKFSVILGAFFWTSHVLAFLAKQAVPQAATFTLMESFYLMLQFGIYGVLLGLIHRNASPLSDGD